MECSPPLFARGISCGSPSIRDSGGAGPPDLWAQIQGGFKLRSVAATVAPAKEEEPDLLAQIRMGMKLKKASEREAAPAEKADAGSIATAMEQYRKLVADSDSDSDSDDSDDWSD